MTNLNELTKTFAFDTKSVEDGFKTLTSFGERLSGITLDAAVASNEIAAKTAQETFANLRNVAVVRDEPAEYGRAFADFAQKQAELALRTAEAFGGVFQSVQTNATDLVSEAGAQTTETVAANANTAARKTTRTAKKAA
jgi:Phasin protein